MPPFILQLGNDGVAVFFRRGAAAQVRCEVLLFSQDFVDGFADLGGNGRFADVFQEHAG